MDKPDSDPDLVSAPPIPIDDSDVDLGLLVEELVRLCSCFRFDTPEGFTGGERADRAGSPGLTSPWSIVMVVVGSSI